jgi:hypothetical protein
MRVFRLVDGSSWIARPGDAEDADAGVDTDGGDDGEGRKRIGWRTIVFESDDASAQRLVYRPPGWLAEASLAELIAAIDESVAVRLRWAPD